MPFTVTEFPGQVFRSIGEYTEAKHRRRNVEESLARKSEEIVHVTATVIPAPKGLLEKAVTDLQRQVSELSSEVQRLASGKIKTRAGKKANKEGLQVGTILQGESRSRKYTLEVLDEDYLCSNGSIYQSLSGAALGVSGNRRSGWKFWKDLEGNPIGELTGRFKGESRDNPFRTSAMS